MRFQTLPALLALLACAKQDPEGPARIQTRVSLARAATCDALTESVHETAVRQMRAQMDAWKSSGPLVGLPASAGNTPVAAAAPASYSTTNTQVAGVDEADFMKNDGTRIFVLSGRTLFAATSWPPQDLSVAGKLEIEGWPGTMFLDGNTAVVFSTVWTVPKGGGMGPGTGTGAVGATAVPCASEGYYYCGWPTAKITVVDVTDLSSPKAVNEIYLPGQSTGARRIASSVRLVLSDAIRWPEAMVWWPRYDPQLYQDPNKFAAAIDALEDANEKIIRATPLQSWFPEGKRKLANGTEIDVGYSCGDFYVSNAPERLGLVTIATLDLAHLDAGVSRASIVGEAGVLYANEKRLYLASQHWWWWPMAGQLDWTYVHGFDISDPAAARYFGSGGVEGHVPDQFAMDEQDGYLRVASNTVKYVGDPATPAWFRSELGSRLSILAPQPAPDGEGSTLALIGEIPELEAGERLFATRFLGDRGFAVTFRYVDPLVTLDLRDPAHPKKVAELTLPGFSEYLQPIDDNHLLAIGVELPLNPDGRPDGSRRSLELSLFDVSDLGSPKRTAQVLIGTAAAYSEALWDHHAFNWYRPDPAKPGLLAIPFSDWIQPAPSPWWSGFVSDVRLFSVDPASGIAPLGSLGMGDVYIQQGSGNWTWWYRPWVRRSVLATDQGGTTFAYAVSDAGVRVAALPRLDAPLATALFTKGP